MPFIITLHSYPTPTILILNSLWHGDSHIPQSPKIHKQN